MKKEKKNSIFDFSIISIEIIEREDFKTFENEKKIVRTESTKYYIMEQILNQFHVY